MEKEEEKIHTEYGFFSNIKFILKLMYKYAKKIFILYLPIGIVAGTVVNYLWSFVLKFIIDLLTNGGQVPELLKGLGIFFSILVLASFGNCFYNNRIWTEFIFIRLKVIVSSNRKAMRMDFQNTEDPKILDCYQKAQQATGGNEDGVEGMERHFVSFILRFFIVAAGLIIMGTMNVWIVLIMTALAFVDFAVTNFSNRYNKYKIWDPFTYWWRKHGYMNWILKDFGYAKDIRMFGLRPWLTRKFTDLTVERYNQQKKNNRFWFWMSILRTLLWIICMAMVYAYLIVQIYKHNITIGSFTFYLSAATSFFSTLSSFLDEINTLLAKSRQIDDFRTFIDLPDMDFSQWADNGVLKPVPQYESYEFVFENVSFKYPRAEQFALKNLSITLKAGERLAVVGLNGAGKSTFIKLLLRLYEPTEGRILLNGEDIRSFDRDSYYAIFAPVFQEVNYFAMSVAENVSLEEKEKIDREFVNECVKKSGFGEKVKKLPNGIDSELRKVIYDDGTDLSGGEQQKLSLARALYKNCPVVVLDEPTAALDALAESQLYKDFDSLIGGKTSVYISHRLSSTQFCNNIAMFKDGQMIEYGTHKSLMEAGGEYAKMFNIQAQYYIENGEVQ